MEWKRHCREQSSEGNHAIPRCREADHRELPSWEAMRRSKLLRWKPGLSGISSVAAAHVGGPQTNGMNLVLRTSSHASVNAAAANHVL